MAQQDLFDDIDIYLNLGDEPPDVRALPEKSRTSQKGGFAHPRKKTRLSNNTFKAPLRLFIKVILGIEGPESLRFQVRAISKEKNLQTFPKLVCFCQRQGLRRQITQIWTLEIQDYLGNKRKILPIEQYQELQKWANRMTQALSLTEWSQLIETYWGDKVRHKDKLNNCIEEIEKINAYEY